VDAAILSSAIDLLATVGPSGATINAVARRSGVARASIYLRYPSRDALLDAAMRSAIGRLPYLMTGDLAADMRGGAEQARAILASPTFQQVLPMLVAHMLRPGRADEPLSFDALFPNRRLLADEYRTHAAAGGYRSDVEPEMAADLILGAMLIHLLATGRVPTATFTAHLPEVVVAALRAPA